MKKLLKKIRRQKPETEEQPNRITNETVAAHREKILAGGRRFKYPVQYAKHRLVLNSIIIAIIGLALLGLVGWQQLYKAQNTTKFMYRLTQLIPVPVANVDGQSVAYSDYLKKYRSSINYLQQQNSINLGTKDGQRQAEFIKRRELNGVELDAYAQKIADQKHITVTGKEVDDFIKKDLSAKSVSLDAYENTVLKTFYDWSLDEYKGVVRNELLKRKVAFAIDTDAKVRLQAVQARVKTEDFAAVASSASEDVATKPNGGDIGDLPLDNQDPNGLITVANTLQVGQISDPITGSDGYYIIKLIAKTDSTIHYAQIKVGLTAFQSQFDAIQKTGKIQEYITVAK